MTISTQPQSCSARQVSHDKKLNWFAHTAPAALIVLFMWLPFGFTLTGLLEEWGVIGSFSRVGVFFLTDASSAMPAHALRPLTIFPHAVAYSLDPNSFDYWHVLLIIALILKGLSISIIATRITGALKWGMLASVLIIVFPADTMQLSFRSIHINWAFSLTLLASAVFLQALEQKNKWRSFALSICASLLLGAGCAMYEVALLLAVIPALVILIQIGLRGVAPHLKAFYGQHLIWAAAPIAYVAYVLHTLPLVQSYQSAVVGDSAFHSFIQNFSKIFSLGVQRSVLGGWIDAWKITYFEISSHWYLAIATAILLVIIAAVNKRSIHNANPGLERSQNRILPARMAVTGLILICLGYLPFIFNPAHMAVSQRTFLYAAPGAILVLLALFLIVHRYSKIATTALSALLIFTGLGAQLFQFQHYIDISKRQQSVLNDIAYNFDGNALNKTVLILDYSNELNHDWMFLNPDLSAILFHVYGKPVDTVEICYMPSHEWQQTDPLQRKGTCEETEDGWTLNYPVPFDSAAPASKKLSRAQVITIAVGNGKTEPANTELQAWRLQLDASTSLTGARLRGITETHPWFDFFRFRNRSQDEYYWDFGRWWSMAPPIAGSGWRNTEWKTRRFTHTATAWKIAPRSSLNFYLTPAPEPYAISGLFNDFANEKIRAEMQVLVNGTVIPVQWRADGSFEGGLKPELLRSGRNVIEFVSTVDNNHDGLAARLDWVRIAKRPD
ncbi:hypothetical protein [Pseudomonas moraviensis]|uniref:hypothetical protein n=1 Tax=Pseudomonas moraviensis TaxID=321662 RepID=UPI00249137DD|nr:hypothetical protein [Pseudomonas moraviensis]